MLVINRTKEQITLEIVLANGTADSINLQPQSRANLPPGATLNPTKTVVYNRICKIIEDAPPEPTAESPVIVPESDMPQVTESAGSDSVTISDSNT